MRQSDDGGPRDGSKGTAYAGSPSPPPQAGTHRTLVEALGEPKALAQLGGASWLPNDAWTAALETVRRSRFPNEPVPEGFRRVGQQLGRGFLASDIGHLTRETASVLPPERIFGVLLPMLSQRMRHDFGYEWLPSAAGGVLRVSGSFVTAPQVTLGFMEAFAGLVDRPVKVSIQSADDNCLDLAFAW